jgi:hypothetical protein
MTQIPEELVERMIALIRCMAAADVSRVPADLDINCIGVGTDYDDARAIAALLPESVDPDVLIVRAVLHAHQRAMTPPDSGWGDMSYLKGSYDHLPVFEAALAAYRAELGK